MPDKPVESCPGCGRMIQMPCRACVAEGHRQQVIEGHKPGLANGDGDLSLKLTGQALKRYRWLREMKARAGLS